MLDVELTGRFAKEFVAGAFAFTLLARDGLGVAGGDGNVDVAMLASPCRKVRQ